MIKTLVPPNYNSARTAEIMSRYRPIAPKPENPVTAADNQSSITTQSPYLRSLWQTRPTRTRKRGRAAVSPPTIKRSRTHHHILGLNNYSFHSFNPLPNPNPNPAAFQISTVLTTPPQSDLVTLSLLPTSAPREISSPRKVVIDLNTVAAAETPEENNSNVVVIAPQPIRPVGSSIKVGCISEDPIAIGSSPVVHVVKRPEEVEREVELEAFPAIISDSSYRVRLANSAYKEMVGQPECSWLDSIVTGKRICGEVVLHLADSEVPLPSSSDKFFCWVNIEWEHEGKKKTVRAFCDVMRLSCHSKDYLFSWRFHTRGNSNF